MALKGMRIKIIQTYSGFTWPDFSKLQIIKDLGVTVDQYIRYWGGIHYDEVSPINEHTEDSPLGIQYAMGLFPIEFVNEACSKFPECTLMTEAQVTDFYNNRSKIYEPEYIIKGDILQNIANKVSLGIPKTAFDIDSLDPNKDTPGIVNNPLKTWAGFKNHRNLTMEQDV